MERDESDFDAREQRLNAVVATYLQAVETGQTPDRDAFVLEHLEFAGELRELFAGCDVLRQITRPPLPRNPVWSAPEAAESRGLSGTAIDADTTDDGPAETVTVPHSAAVRTFGRFELLEELGRGGMGVVYRARDPRLNREVALKMLRDARLSSPREVARFQNEVQAVARLDHPGIVPIYEVGEHDGQRYFTMKLIEGGRLSRQLEQFQHNPRAAAALVADAADAIHHAHQRGILHRDLKPSNILVDAAGRPHVTDFGLARPIEGASELTGTGETTGTPPYMAPEQAAGRNDAVTLATDVYGLGAVLYTLLTGAPPFAGETPLATLRLVIQFEPQPPRSRNPRVDRDLEIICLKALSKEPERRYASAADLAADLRRYLAGEAIRARVPSRREVAWRWVRANRTGVALIVTVILATVAGIAGLLLYSRDLARVNARLTRSANEAQQARDEAERKEREAEDLAYAATIRLAAKALQERDPRQVIELLNRVRPQAGDRDPRGFEWHYLWQEATAEGVQIAASSEALYHVAYSPDGRLVACCGKDAIVRIYDTAKLEVVLSFATGQIETNCVAFSPDGRVLATTGDDGTVRLWDVKRGAGSRTGSSETSLREILRIPAHPGKAFQVVFSPDGETLYTCGDDPVIRVWNAANGERRREITGHGSGDVEALSLSPDGRFLASAGNDRTARIWETGTGEEHCKHSADYPVTGVAFSPDGSLVAISETTRHVGLYHIGTKQRISGVVNLDGFSAVTFSVDGRLAAVDKAGNIATWSLTVDPATGLPIMGAAPTESTTSGPAKPAAGSRVWNGHSGRAYAVAFHPDGRTLASVGQDGQLRIWNSTTEPRQWTMPVPGKGIEQFAPIADTEAVATIEYGQLRIYDTRTGLHAGRPVDLEFRCDAIAVSADGRLLAGMTKERQLVVGDINKRKMLARTFVGRGPEAAGHIVFSPDSRLLAVRLGLGPEPVWLFEAETCHVLHRFATAGTSACPAFSPNGELVAMNSLNDILIYRTATGALLHRLHGHESTIYSVAFSRDGKLLASSSDDRTVRLWNAQAGTPRATFVGHRDAVNEVLFSPDGRSLMSGDDAGVLKVWHVPTAQELCELQRSQGAISDLCYMAGGSALAWRQGYRIHIRELPEDAAHRSAPRGQRSGRSDELYRLSHVEALSAPARFGRASTDHAPTEWNSYAADAQRIVAARPVTIAPESLPDGATIADVTATIYLHGENIRSGDRLIPSVDARRWGLQLISPAGTAVDLIQPGSLSVPDPTAGRYEVVLYDHAADPLPSDGVPKSGFFLPVQSLAPFCGEDPAGTWQVVLSGDPTLVSPAMLLGWKLQLAVASPVKRSADGNSASTEPNAASIANPQVSSASRVAPSGADLLVSSFDTDQVLRYDQTGKYLGVFASGGGLDGPHGLTFGPDGHLYVCGRQNNGVLRFDGTTGVFIDTFATGGGLLQPQRLAFGPDGKLYVSAHGPKVYRFDGTTGDFIDTFAENADSAGGESPAFGAMDFGGDGYLYVADHEGDAIVRLNGTTGVRTGTFGGPVDAPGGLAFGPHGDLCVTSSSTGAVFRFQGTTGELLASLSPGDTGFCPSDLAFGPDGNLYVASAPESDGAGRVLRFHGSTGQFLGTFASGGLLRSAHSLVFMPQPDTPQPRP